MAFFNQEQFDHIRSLYLNDRVYFAQADINDPEFWEKVGAISRLRGEKVTDVYVSNIPHMIEKYGDGWNQKEFDKLVGLTNGNAKTNYYSSVGSGHRPFTMQTETINGEQPKGNILSLATACSR